jgi:hypothetical protein
MQGDAHVLAQLWRARARQDNKALTDQRVRLRMDTAHKRCLLAGDAMQGNVAPT